MIFNQNGAGATPVSSTNIMKHCQNTDCNQELTTSIGYPKEIYCSLSCAIAAKEQALHTNTKFIREKIDRKETSGDDVTMMCKRAQVSCSLTELVVVQQNTSCI